MSKLHEDFSKSLKNDINIVVFTNETTEHCDETVSTAKELVELDERIHVPIYNVDRNLEASNAYRVRIAPTTILARHGEKDGGIRFTGVPTSYQFSALVDAIGTFQGTRHP